MLYNHDAPYRGESITSVNNYLSSVIFMRSPIFGKRNVRKNRETGIKKLSFFWRN